MSLVQRRNKPPSSSNSSPSPSTPSISPASKPGHSPLSSDSFPTSNSYWLTRVVLLRYLGFIYFVAFFCAATQLPALIGKEGLLPATLYLKNIKSSRGDESYYDFPTVFWLCDTDTCLTGVSWAGVILSALVMLGFGCMPVMFLLWALYMSISNIGQLFYGYGWEIQLLETGFLGIFLSPFLPSELHPNKPTPVLVLYLYKWLIFRIMLGAGMIKIRGDHCWRDLTCLDYHYETQPIPNPISWYLHNMPQWFQAAGVMFNHIVELGIPFLMLIPVRFVQWTAGVFLIGFQILLIVSGNLSFLNYLTIVPAIACFDDSFFVKFATRTYYQKWRRVVQENLQNKKSTSFYIRVFFNVLLLILVTYLSIDPVRNLISPRQAMNRSFDRLHLVNTYGAFGHVGRTRNEVIIMGTNSSDPLAQNAVWLEYEFKCKPGRIDRRPCVIAPFQSRVDWQIWFAAMSNYQNNPWLVHMIYKLLKGDNKTLALLDPNEGNPFGVIPPTYIKADLYEYYFTTYIKNASFSSQLFDGHRNWWNRKFVASYLQPLSLDNDSLRKFIKQNRWRL